MAKERLSKLQKWILKFGSQGNYQKPTGELFTGMVKRQDIFRYFKPTFTLGDINIPIQDNFKAFCTDKEYNKMNAIISRSIQNLQKKGFVDLIGHKKVVEFDLESIERDRAGCETKEEYMEKYKNDSLLDNIKKEKEFIKTKDITIKIEKGCSNNAKILMMTEKGKQKGRQLLRLSSDK